MARAWRVHVLRPRLGLASAARRIIAVRAAEVFSYGPFVQHPERITELHDLRIAVKRLRYSLELFRNCLPPTTTTIVTKVKTLQELLGEVHDADVLADLIKARLTEVAGAHQTELIDELTRAQSSARQRHAIDQSLQAAASDRRLGLFALLGRTLRRRQQAYQQVVRYWEQLTAEGFRDQVMILSRPATAPEPDANPATASLR